jgi:hypothetical protein
MAPLEVNHVLQDDIALERLTTRGIELIVYVCRMWPQMKENVDREFLDWNYSLQRLCSETWDRNPWRGPHMGTIISTTKMICRLRKLDDPRGWVLKQISGMELLHVAGIHHTALHWPLPPNVDDEVLSSMAGNAFSAYAHVPLMLSFLPLLFLTRENFGIKLKEQASVETNSVCDAELESQGQQQG